jgi:UDP-N-acetylmuramoyl-tripeptide--D-alanyl-D-alanine ligase
MACHFSLSQLAAILSVNPVQFPEDAGRHIATGISTDTRSLQAGQVFLALRGEQFDGHAFVERALEKGAIAAIVASNWEQSDANACDHRLPLFQVPDTLAAYHAIAHWWRNQFTIPVIAVTGSVGKTTTKELIAAVLSRLSAGASSSTASVLKSAANYNNEVGVPKTLLQLDSGHDYAIIEMGMRGRGEIALLSQTARPDIALITNVGTAHIERLGSEEAIAEAKCELLAEMPATGIAILNQDNPLLLQTADMVWRGKTVTFGLDGGDLHGQWIAPDRLRLDGMTFPIPFAGRHQGMNYLAALAVARVLGLDLTPLTQGLSVELPGGRARRYVLPNDIVILDETYNAGLESMLASLHLLAETPGTRRIAVLGTMKELGMRSLEFHHKVGATVQELHLDGLLILADPAEAEAMAKGAAPLLAERFDNHVAVVDRLKQLVRPGDRLLFKASRAVGLDQVVEQFRTQANA